jgi:SsrA-binding protein
MAPKGTKVVASNRRARHDYDILDTFECGIVLTGSEVKSIRDGKIQLKDSYARVQDGELWLHGVHVSPYVYAHGPNAHDPDRARKLLLHRAEIDELMGRTQQESLTLAKGRRHYDKRQAIAKREADREAERAMSRARRRNP